MYEKYAHGLITNPFMSLVSGKISDLANLKRIYFGPNDLRIASHAIKGAQYIEHLRFRGETTNTWLGMCALNDLPKLKRIVFEPPYDGINLNSSENLISEFAFYKCPELKEVNFLWGEDRGPLGVHTYNSHNSVVTSFNNGTLSNNTIYTGVNNMRDRHSEDWDVNWWKNHGITVYFKGVKSTLYN
jgi:hypothetical protein